MHGVAVQRAGREVSSISTHTSIYKDNWDKERDSYHLYILCISSIMTDGLCPWFHGNRLI